MVFINFVILLDDFQKDIFAAYPIWDWYYAYPILLPTKIT